jgi:biopolymer transport protein ExbD
MRFRQPSSAKPPTVDLIPMLTVMMGVLAFFVVVTMTLGNEKLVEMKLPAPQPDADQPQPALTTQPFIIELDSNGQVRLNNQPIDQAALEGQLEAYLSRQEDHIAYLLPNQDLPYEDVMQFLGEMRAIGGDRVSLAIEE